MAQPPIQAQNDPDLQLAVQYLQLGRLPDAEKLLRSAVQRLGDRPDALHFLAVCVAERGEHAEAETLWRRAIARDPGQPMLHFNLGVMLHRLGRTETAIPCYRAALRLSEDYHEAELRLATAYAELGRFSAAEREYARLVRRIERQAPNPVDPVLRGQLWAARAGLGYVLYRLGRLDEALRTFETALADIPRESAARAEIAGDRALVLGALGRHDEALREIDGALALRADSANLHNAKGYLCMIAGRPADAVVPLVRAVELAPGFVDARRSLARAKIMTGDGAGAGGLLQQLVATNPLDRESLYDLTTLQISEGRFQEAILALQPILDGDGSDPRALNNLALALRGLQRYEEAHKALRRAARLAPAEGLILTNLARSLTDCGRPQEALPLHEKAVAMMPGDPRPLGHLGATLQALGEHAGARAAWEKALQLDPQNPDAVAGMPTLPSVATPAAQ